MHCIVDATLTEGMCSQHLIVHCYLGKGMDCYAGLLFLSGVRYTLLPHSACCIWKTTQGSLVLRRPCIQYRLGEGRLVTKVQNLEVITQQECLLANQITHGCLGTTLYIEFVSFLGYTVHCAQTLFSIASAALCFQHASLHHCSLASRCFAVSDAFCRLRLTLSCSS